MVLRPGDSGLTAGATQPEPRGSDDDNDDDEFEDANDVFAADLGDVPLHRAAYDDDVKSLERALRALPPTAWGAHDGAGNTAAHVAVLRGSHAALQLLLARGAPCDAKSAAGWRPLDEAVQLGDVPAAVALRMAQIRDEQRRLREVRPAMLARLAAMPDVTLALRWEFTSPLFGALLRRVAPSDTYAITKRGTRLRLDGSLKGLKRDAAALLPAWRRGRFSLLFDGGGGGSAPQLWFVNHEKREAVDWSEGGGGEVTPAEVRQEVTALMRGDAAGRKPSLSTRDVEFAPLLTWGGAPRRERVGGYDAQLFEAAGRVALLERRKRSTFDTSGTFERYLASAGARAADEVVSALDEPPPPGDGAAASPQGGTATPHDGGGKSAPRGGGGGGGGAPRHHRVAARCWMAEGHPLRVGDVLPLLETLSLLDPAFGRVAQGLRRLVAAPLFPVKVQVPLLATVALVLTFGEPEAEACRAAAAAGDAWFALPDDYARLGVRAKLRQLRAKARPARAPRRSRSRAQRERTAAPCGAQHEEEEEEEEEEGEEELLGVWEATDARASPLERPRGDAPASADG